MEDEEQVIDAAMESIRRRRFADAVVTCRSALALEPRMIDVRLLLARALLALRRDAEAQVEVAAVMQLRPTSAEGYQLLGELAFRRQEWRAAEIFLREALRLAPSDEVRERLALVLAMETPVAAAAKLPAASAATGPSSAAPRVPRNLALGTEPAIHDASRIDIDLADFDGGATSIGETASGSDDTELTAACPDDGIDDATAEQPRADRLSPGDEWTPAGTPLHGDLHDTHEEPLPLPPPPRRAARVQPEPPPPARKPAWLPAITDHGEATRIPGASHAESVALRVGAGHAGFGEYLVTSGALTRAQLYRVLQLKDWKQVRLGEAAVQLGFLSERRTVKLLRRYQELVDSAAATL